jgi:hypothetical protein
MSSVIAEDVFGHNDHIIGDIAWVRDNTNRLFKAKLLGLSSWPVGGRELSFFEPYWLYINFKWVMEGSRRVESGRYSVAKWK